MWFGSVGEEFWVWDEGFGSVDEVTALVAGWRVTMLREFAGRCL